MMARTGTQGKIDRCTCVSRNHCGPKPGRSRARSAATKAWAGVGYAPGEKDVDMIGLEMGGLEIGQSTAIFAHEGGAGGTACPTKERCSELPSLLRKM